MSFLGNQSEQRIWRWINKVFHISSHLLLSSATSSRESGRAKTQPHFTVWRSFLTFNQRKNYFAIILMIWWWLSFSGFSITNGRMWNFSFPSIIVKCKCGDFGNKTWEVCEVWFGTDTLTEIIDIFLLCRHEFVEINICIGISFGIFTRFCGCIFFCQVTSFILTTLNWLKDKGDSLKAVLLKQKWM